MHTKQDILAQIKRTAQSNGGVPMGTARFETETGIKPHDWGKFWPRIGDAQKEAGFAPNQRQAAHSDEFICQKMIGLMRSLGRLPTTREITSERTADPEFPSRKAVYRLGKSHFKQKLTQYCISKGGCEDILGFCQIALDNPEVDREDEPHSSEEILADVYLFKSGSYYKIGRTSDTVRRGTEIRLQLPERLHLIHSIRTDDPSGVEAYWHRRFESKRMKGEWFKLNSADIRAFKRWKRIY